MSIMSEYEAIKRELYSAIEDALPQLAGELIDEIKTAADAYVYSYMATEEAMGKRRYELGEKYNFEEQYGQDYVSITNVTEQQGTDYGVPEVDFVERGLTSYRQPYPREFMNKALEKYIDSGSADATLRRVLFSRGLDADLTVIGE